MIACAHVSKRYGERTVLSDVSFELHPKEWVTILGPSGSGKSTLVQLLLGLEEPTEGTVTADGADLRTLPPPILQLYRSRIGWNLQETPLLAHGTVAENLAYPLEAQETPPARIAKTVAAMLATLRMTDRAAALPRELSRGERALVSLARALIAEPMILLLDEPLAHLDPEQSGIAMEMLTEMHRAGASILVLTSNPALAQAGGGRVLKLTKGTIAAGMVKERTFAPATPHRILEAAAIPIAEESPDTLDTPEPPKPADTSPEASPPAPPEAAASPASPKAVKSPVARKGAAPSTSPAGVPPAVHADKKRGKKKLPMHKGHVRASAEVPSPATHEDKKRGKKKGKDDSEAGGKRKIHITAIGS